jgi:magnesium transporter
MNIWNCGGGKPTLLKNTVSDSSSKIVIICDTGEAPALADFYGFDAGTIANCVDLDESVRYTCFDGYDFISLVYANWTGERFVPREINLYVSAKFLILVMPLNSDSEQSGQIKTAVLNAMETACGKAAVLNRLYLVIFDALIQCYSTALEKLEDDIESLMDKITQGIQQSHFSEATGLRSHAYLLRKQLRATSYIGEQILTDENDLIAEKQERYFRSVATRLDKLHTFSENLYELSSELLRSYDSRLNTSMNERINRLTVITLFIGLWTVVAGIYGMNFEFMPELGWKLGYPFALGIMLAASAIVYAVLKRNKWL